MCYWVSQWNLHGFYPPFIAKKYSLLIYRKVKGSQNFVRAAVIGSNHSFATTQISRLSVGKLIHIVWCMIEAATSMHIRQKWRVSLRQAYIYMGEPKLFLHLPQVLYCIIRLSRAGKLCFVHRENYFDILQYSRTTPLRLTVVVVRLPRYLWKRYIDKKQSGVKAVANNMADEIGDFKFRQTRTEGHGNDDYASFSVDKTSIVCGLDKTDRSRQL